MEKMPEHTLLPINEGEMSPREKELVDAHFCGGKKLNIDYVNAYMDLYYKNAGSRFKEMQPMQTYEEYFETYPSSYAYTMRLSDSGSIKNLNELVIKFNHDLRRMISEKDGDAVELFLKNVDGLMRS